ncbi:MAG: PspC domain-containing protein [Bacteroidetes bacterium]|nr:PspC domain-containing protein [Bacteroidota bacterium]
MKKLYRSNERRLLGICGGIAEYFDIDPVIIRLLWLFFTMLGGCGIILYLIAWIVIPSKPNYKN